ncbi:MAG: alpha/beta fold hydrolase [Candidatus Daviesbacteria bacterium]|nr:alpha/beta fold hydrolase [Candidatus Daviesbacteria bacterium]
MPVKFTFIFIVLFLVGLISFIKFTSQTKVISPGNTQVVQQVAKLDPLSIEVMRQRSYPGSDFIIEQTLADGSNYHQYVASYLSEGLKIYGLLTVPIGDRPQNGWPVIIFNHGYIPPTQYRTTERYVAYVDGFARSGYIVFKSDYRGHGSSEGQPEGAYYSPAYTVDILNALAAVKKYKDTDPSKIGMWGHSLGGNITLRSLAVSPDIRVAVIWGGVVGTYDDLMNNWQRRVTYTPPPNELALRNRSRADLISKYGTPGINPDFWNSIDPNFHLDLVNAPVQLNAGLSDEEVPWQFSQGLQDRLEKEGKTVELYTYPGTDHNISQSFNSAMQHSLDFFNKYLK